MGVPGRVPTSRPPVAEVVASCHESLAPSCQSRSMSRRAVVARRQPGFRSAGCRGAPVQVRRFTNLDPHGFRVRSRISPDSPWHLRSVVLPCFCSGIGAKATNFRGRTP